MKGPSLVDNIAAVPKRIALADWPVTGRAVFNRSMEEPGLVCVPGRTTPEIGRPVAVRGRALYEINMFELFFCEMMRLFIDRQPNTCTPS